MTTRVMFVDDHRMVRDAVVLLISHEPDLTVVGVADDGRSAVSVARWSRPEVVLMDLDMPGVDGLTATRSLLAFDPGLRVVVLSASCTSVLIDAAAEAGACGYLVKGVRARDLLDGIRLAAGGGHPVAPQVAAVRGRWPGPAGPEREPPPRDAWGAPVHHAWYRVATVLVLVALLLAAPCPALAHSDLVGSTPRDGDTVRLGTDRLVLVFGEELLPGSEQVVVRDVAGDDVVAGTPSVAGATLELPLDLRTPGRHLVTYRVLSGDGHAVVGEVSFDVARAGDRAVAVVPPVTETAGATGATEATGATLVPPAWWTAAAAVAVGLVLLVRRHLRGARR